ncbi:MAG TPA: trehalose-6-phosphate synthase [Terriglobales bacterium]|jgi:trehalose 6-phosphate synthase|nr:trehalose-6-phosphate synthase [Terriglobales bacterium]
MKTAGDLILVSNRLPASIEPSPGGPVLKPSSGGLVTALRPVLEARKGYWIGWPGEECEDFDDVDRLLRDSGTDSACQLVPVSLTADERKGFYSGFSNEIIWPLFHDLQSRCNFDPVYWKTYVEVNHKFAQVVARVAKNDSVVWVHDYHLMLVGDFLRKAGLRCRLGFFLHIPFPPLDIFEKLPWRSQIMRALFEFDVIGLQTARDQQNFAGCVRRFLPEINLHRDHEQFQANVDGRNILVGSFPIGIDFDEFADEAEQTNVAQRAAEIRREIGGRQIVLGVDRLDYTKGVPERLKAFRLLLASHKELQRQISLVQIVVPSRENIPKYQELKLEIETLTSQINGQYGDPGWMPIHYIHRHLDRPELLALYRIADIALITPLKDGMNLVAKEFCAAQAGDHGVLVLSEFAGAADQLRNGAVLVNPYDIEAVAKALHEAFHMSLKERRTRMRKLRRNVRNQNVFRWFEQFCKYLESPEPQRVSRVRTAHG